MFPPVIDVVPSETVPPVIVPLAVTEDALTVPPVTVAVPSVRLPPVTAPLAVTVDPLIAPPVIVAVPSVRLPAVTAPDAVTRAALRKGCWRCAGEPSRPAGKERKKNRYR